MRRIGFVLALFLGTASCVKSSTHQKALAKIDVLQKDLTTSQEEAARRAERIKALEGDLGSTQADRDKAAGDAATRSQELDKIRGEKEATDVELLELRKQRDAAEKRIAAFKALQDKFRALTSTGKLEVLFRNGQMVLKLPSGILFPSGSDELSRDGLTALTEVFNVLLPYKDRRFVIAGHTDAVPIKSSKFKNNWYLSTARAIRVLQFMIDSGFGAKNLAASGYGEFDPIAPNDTDANRELNRRIEIILVPNLEELPSLTGETP